MPSLRDKIDYLTAIAIDRPLTRSDFQRSSDILYERKSSCRVTRTIATAPVKRDPRRTVPPRFSPGEAQVIRELYQNGGVDYKDLKDWLGVAKSTICHVVARKGAYKKRNFATDF